MTRSHLGKSSKPSLWWEISCFSRHSFQPVVSLAFSAFTLNLSYVHRIISNPTDWHANSAQLHPQTLLLTKARHIVREKRKVWLDMAGIRRGFLVQKAQEVVEHRPLWPQCVDVARCVLKVLSRKAAACKITSADLGSEARIRFSLHGSAFTLSSAFTKEYSFSWLIFTDPWRNQDSLRAHQNLPPKKRLSNYTHPGYLIWD